MAKFSSFSLAIFAILLASLFAFSTVEAAPAPAPSASLTPVPSTIPKPAPKPAPKPNPAKPPAFSFYSLPNLKGKVEKVTAPPKNGCLNHKLKTVGSVKKGSGPTFNLQFYSGKNCKGSVTHAMSSETVKQMGGPYKSNSVRITQCKGKDCAPMA